MESRGRSAWALLLLGVGGALPGCATQHDTAQALTIAGAAAVVIGASMAADEQCYNAAPGEGGVQAYCAPGLSKGARTAGKGLAVAGVGLAAAGYALKPKGPDRLQRPPADPDAVPSSPYRLLRRDPAPVLPEAAPPASSSAEPPFEEPSSAGATPAAGPPAACASGGAPAEESGPGASCNPAMPKKQPEVNAGGAAPGAPRLEAAPVSPR